MIWGKRKKHFNGSVKPLNSIRMMRELCLMQPDYMPKLAIKTERSACWSAHSPKGMVIKTGSKRIPTIVPSGMNPAIKICWGNENELTTKHADDEKEIGSNFIKLSICNARSEEHTSELQSRSDL